MGEKQTTIRYQDPDMSLWKGRVDAYDGEAGLRWHQAIKPLDIEGKGASGFAVIGFGCDLGVIRNLGRYGAKEGPNAVRRALANLAWHNPAAVIYDAGDVIVDNPNPQKAEGEDLEKAQSLFSEKISMLIRAGLHPVAIGGGHEIAKAHFAGIRRAKPDARIGIVNIDAHFDLRKDPAAPTSGTSFLEIHASEKAAGHPFSYLVLGIQPWSNTKALFDAAVETGTQWIEASQIVNEFSAGTHPPSEISPERIIAKSSIALNSIAKSIQDFAAANDVLYLTICMDVLDMAFAPGVSAPAAGGLFPHHVLQLANLVMKTGKVIAFDIAEVSPRLEDDEKRDVRSADVAAGPPTHTATDPGKTARLVAWLIASLTGGNSPSKIV